MNDTIDLMPYAFILFGYLLGSASMFLAMHRYRK